MTNAELFSQTVELEADLARLRQRLLDGEATAATLRGEIAAIKHEGLSLLLALAHDRAAVMRLARLDREQGRGAALRLLECSEAAEARDVLGM